MRTRKVYGFFRVLNISDRFEGNSEAAMSCLSLLFGQNTLGLNKACLRYGCTCSDCVGGFISARMRSSLTFQGELTYDLMQEGIDDGRFWVEDNDYIIVHLDSNVRQNLKSNKSLRRGFVNIFRIAVECLKALSVFDVHQ